MTHAKYVEVKTMLKAEAKELHMLKFNFKESQRKRDFRWELRSELNKAKKEWRHKHIAYCLLGGTPIEEIERYCSEDNPRDELLIQKYLKEFNDE